MTAKPKPPRKRPARKLATPAGKKRGAGQPPFEPSEKDRKYVQTMAAVGTTRPMMARVIGIAQNTLRKYFPDELAISRVKVLCAAYEGLFKNATTPTERHPGGHPASQMFILKTQGGFRETTHHEVTGKDGEPIEHAHEFKDLEKLDAAALAVLYRAAVTPGLGDR